jgi:drug/metabolite transporter (DMT)-like permease
MTSYEILYTYSLPMMVMNYLYVKNNNANVLAIPKEYRNIIVFRAIVGFLGMQGKLTSLKYMPVSIGSAIFYTLPLFSSLMALLVLKEKLNKVDVF